MKYILQAHKQKARLEVERWHAPSATGKHAHLPTYMTYNSLGVHYSMKTAEMYESFSEGSGDGPNDFTTFTLNDKNRCSQFGCNNQNKDRKRTRIFMRTAILATDKARTPLTD